MVLGGTSSPPIPTPIAHEPYVIEDSSKIQVLDGGLQLYVVEKGNGPIPQANQTLIAHYHGMLLNGKVFDSSFDRGTTTAFRLDQVIKGWTMGLTKVPVGSKIKLIIPPELAYGAAGRPSIPANSTLIFDVQMVSVY